MAFKFFNKKTSGGAIKNEIKQNQQLAKEPHKPNIRKFKKEKFILLILLIIILFLFMFGVLI